MTTFEVIKFQLDDVTRCDGDGRKGLEKGEVHRCQLKSDSTCQLVGLGCRKALVGSG